MALTYPEPRIPPWRAKDRLLRALDAGNVSVSEMADVLGVHRNTVSSYISGRTKAPKSVLRVWALRCGVPYRWLADGTEDEEGDTLGVTLWELGEGFEQLELAVAA